MKLPIDVVPNSRPMRFKWRQTITTPIGSYTINHEGELPASVEEVVVLLIGLSKQLVSENAELKSKVDVLTKQYDILTKRAETKEKLLEARGKK